MCFTLPKFCLLSFLSIYLYSEITYFLYNYFVRPYFIYVYIYITSYCVYVLIFSLWPTSAIRIFFDAHSNAMALSFMSGSTIRTNAFVDSYHFALMNHMEHTKVVFRISYWGHKIQYYCSLNISPRSYRHMHFKEWMLLDTFDNWWYTYKLHPNIMFGPQSLGIQYSKSNTA